MNRFPFVGLTLLGLGLVGIVGVAAYAAGSHWRHDDGQVTQVVSSAGEPSAGSAPVVRVIEPEGHWHGGFFPGFIFLPLLFFGFFWLVAGGFGQHRWYGGRPWSDSFEEWHHRQHASWDTGPTKDKPAS